MMLFLFHHEIAREIRRPSHRKLTLPKEFNSNISRRRLYALRYWTLHKVLKNRLALFTAIIYPEEFLSSFKTLIIRFKRYPLDFARIITISPQNFTLSIVLKANYISFQLSFAISYT